MKLIIIAVFITVGILDTVRAKALPTFIKTCKRNDPNLSKCIEESIAGLKDRLKKGIAELEVPGIEPFQLNEMTIIHGEKDGLTATVKNLLAHGGSDFKVNSLKVSEDALNFESDLVIPTLRLSGEYNINGQLFKKTVTGQGPFEATLNNFGVKAMLKLNVDKAGKISIDKVDLKVNPGTGKVNIKNLSAGEKTGEVVNNLINEKFDTIVKEVLPSVESAMVKKFTTMAENIAKNFSIDELFPKK